MTNTGISSRALYNLCLMAVFALSAGCNSNPDDDPTPTADWTVIGRIHGRADGGGISSQYGQTIIGYLDNISSLPAVKRYDKNTGQWQDFGTGLVAAYQAIATDQFVNTSFRFVQDGAFSYIFFNRSITQSELVILRSNGGPWLQMPSVPLNQLYGGFYGVLHTGFDFEVKNGVMYVAVRFDSDPETYLCLFTNNGSGWNLMPERISFNHIPGTFSYEGYFSSPRVRVSENGVLYLGYYAYHEATGKSMAHISKFGAQGWEDILGPQHIEGATSTDVFNFYVRTYNGQEQILAIPYHTALNDYRLHFHDGNSWSEIQSVDVSVQAAFMDCADCFVMRTGNSTYGSYARAYANGTWKNYTAARFWGAGGIGFYAQEIAYDASTNQAFAFNIFSIDSIEVRVRTLD